MTNPIKKTESALKEPVEKTISDIKNEADLQLKKILIQGKTIHKFQSNMAILIKRYHSEDSYFGHTARWYGNLSWWIKLILFISLVAGATGIGFALHLMIAVGVTTFVILSLIILLLSNHHALAEKRDKRICEDILELEESLDESVQHLSTIENSLKKVLISLCTMNRRQADDIAAFEGQINKIEPHVHTLSEITGKLDKTKDSLIENTTQMGLSFEKSKLNLTELNRAFAEELSVLTETDNALNITTALIATDYASLNDLNKKIDLSQTQLVTLIENLNILLTTLKQYSEKNQQFAVDAQSKLVVSMNKTQAIRVNNETMITRVDHTLSETMSMLDEQDKINSQHTLELKRNSDDNEKVLARVASLISSQIGNLKTASYGVTK